MRRYPPHQIALAVILLVALLLRGCDLDERPMHADEANQAVKLSILLEHGDYWFDPDDHHGPTLYYFARPLVWLCGDTSLADLTEFSVRLTPALFGTLVVALTAILAAPLGRISMLVAAAFMAVAPPAVYYSRYFIQETLLLAFTLGALCCGRQWLRSHQLRWALAMGVCAGLMQSTKALAPVFAVAALIALSVEYGFRRPPPARLRGFALAFIAALATAGGFYSSFGSNPTGIADAMTSLGSMFDRATEGASGHEKPGSWYATLLTRSYSVWPDWRSAIFLGLALVGYFASWRSNQPLMRWLVIYTTIVAAVLFLTPYKTPWVVIHLVPPLALFAAEPYELPLRWRRIQPGPLFAIAILGVLSLLWMTWTISLTRAAWDPRNPYAYVQAGPDMLKVRPIAERARGAFPEEPIKIVGTDYWPLPWYLRGFPRVGFYPEPPDDCDGALVICSAGLADAVRARMSGTYTTSMLGLRPGVLLVVYERIPGTAP